MFNLLLLLLLLARYKNVTRVCVWSHKSLQAGGNTEEKRVASKKREGEQNSVLWPKIPLFFLFLEISSLSVFTVFCLVKLFLLTHENTQKRKKKKFSKNGSSHHEEDKDQGSVHLLRIHVRDVFWERCLSREHGERIFERRFRL